MENKIINNQVGILTLPLHNYNYGGIIQNYVLQQVIIDLGYTPISIDRRFNRNYRKFGKIISLLKQINVLADIKYSYKKWQYKKRGIKFISPRDEEYIFKNLRDFIKNKIQISEPITSNENFQSYFNKNQFHCLIVGSDQVWRPDYSPNIFNYFFNITNYKSKKIGYAVSYGTTDNKFTDLQIEKCSELAKDFQAISVREIDGINQTKQLFGLEATQVLDPTLLFGRDRYLSLINSVKLTRNNNNKICTYILDNTKFKKSIVDLVSKKLNLDYFENQAKFKIDNPISLDLEDYKALGMEEWLAGFQQSSFVVTDSFHGTIFSIIFQKQFLVIGNRQRGLSRFESILKIFNLTDRLILDENMDIDLEKFKKIDYTSINEKLTKLQKQSLDFLRDNLS